MTVVDADGYPVSIRQTASRYDAETGQMPVVWSPDFAVTEGPAIILCHSHDEKAWNLKMMQIKGRLERRAGDWVFVSTAFTPPSGRLITFWHLSKNGRAAGEALPRQARSHTTGSQLGRHRRALAPRSRRPELATGHHAGASVGIGDPDYCQR